MSKELTESKECEIDGCYEEANNTVEGIVQKNGGDSDIVMDVNLCDKHFLEQCDAQ